METLRTLKKDWPSNKCNPIYIPFAGIIEDNSKLGYMEATSKNFYFCMNNILATVTSTALEPIYYIIKAMISTWKEIIASIKNVRAMFNNIRNSTTDVTKNVMNRSLNITTPIIHNTIIAREALNKTNGIMAAGLLQFFGTYLTLKSLIAAIIELVIILVLVVVAVSTLALYAAAFFTFGATLPAAIAGTIFFISISVPLALVINSIGSKMKIKPSRSIPKVPH